MALTPATNVSFDGSLPKEDPFKAGDIAWVLTSTTLVFIMIPGLAFFYGGMARTKHTLSSILAVVLCVAVVSVQWWIWGYSLAFGRGNAFIGNLDNAFFMDVLDQPDPAPSIPRLLFAVYQCMFAAITPALALGAAAERGRIVPMIVFTFVWSTLVYDVIACWTWNPNGWSSVLGGLDFAGGTPVHISSGAASLAYCLIVGKRKGDAGDFKPHNIVHVVLGTGLLWFGWFGFNGGSALAANMRAIMACVVTNLSASSGGAVWVLIDYIRGRKLSALGFCSGAVAGLVGITPASGFVDPWAAFIVGMVTAAACYSACKLKARLGFDDAVDVFGVHAIGGVCGNILTAFFASRRIASLDKTAAPIAGGWIDGNWQQLGFQMADSAAGFGYSFAVTFLILMIMNRIPGLSLRVDAETEASGLDLAELGELAYHYLQHRTSIMSPSHLPGSYRSMQKNSSASPIAVVDGVTVLRIAADGNLASEYSGAIAKSLGKQDGSFGAHTNGTGHVGSVEHM